MAETLMELSDAGRRCSDTIRMHIAAGMSGKYAAIKLIDGSSDGIAYDTRADAIRHQLHETLCAYVKIPVDDMPPEHATRFLILNRKVYDAGAHFTDPDGPEMFMPLSTESIDAMIRDLRKVRVSRRDR